MKRYSALVLLIFFIVGCSSNANAEYHTYKIVDGMFDYDKKVCLLK